METVDLERRLTRRYVDTFSHLDQWADAGRVKLTPLRQVRHGNGYDDGGTYIRWATFPRNTPVDVRALEDTLSHWGCHHEWDCCGCQSISTSVVHRHGRRVVLSTRVSFNY